MTTISTLATQYTVRQPPRLASSPATVRASKIPSSRPLMMVPTTLPRFSGEASVAASGTRICATTENNPVRAVPIIIIVND